MIRYRLMTKEDCVQATLLLQANAQSGQGGLPGEYPPEIPLSVCFIDDWQQISTFLY